MELVEYPAALLVEDTFLYPRERVDDFNTNQIAEAYQAGATIPPPVVARDGLLIIDGWHRKRAYQKVFGEDAKIEVEIRDYADRSEMFLDAVRLNAAHGNRLSTVDKKRCLILAEEFKVQEYRMWEVLHVRPETARKWSAARATVAAKKDQVGAGKKYRTPGLKRSKRRLVPLKGSMEHLSGSTITVDQEHAMEKVGGLQQSYYVSQVVNLIEHDLLDRSNESLMEKLHYLRELLEREGF